MANEVFDVGKLIRGFNPFSGEKAGKLLYYVIIVVVCLFVFWKLFVAPTNKNTQRAENMTNITNITDESCVDLSVIPPKIKVGGVKLKLFDKK